VRPPLGPAPVELLAPFERFSFRTMEALERRWRGPTERYMRRFASMWMWLSIHNITTVRGLERLAGVRPDQGLLLVSNHRTYFDMYALCNILHHRTPLHQPVYCPVRADFFYEQPLGMLVNLLVGGGRMYPPVFRDTAKGDFNKWALAQMVEALAERPVLIGFHPEGTRNKNDDPYTPLAAQPGVGKLVMETWPLVVPAFINGLSNNFFADARANYRRSKRIVAVFGEPVDLTPFRAMSNRLASHKRIADRLLEMVYKLSEEERQIRRELEGA
jgi:1-acyl-sn-glycerol-3-phosphate acyltransferase